MAIEINYEIYKNDYNRKTNLTKTFDTLDEFGEWMVDHATPMRPPSEHKYLGVYYKDDFIPNRLSSRNFEMDEDYWVYSVKYNGLSIYESFKTAGKNEGWNNEFKEFCKNLQEKYNNPKLPEIYMGPLNEVPEKIMEFNGHTLTKENGRYVDRDSDGKVSLAWENISKETCIAEFLTSNFSQKELNEVGSFLFYQMDMKSQLISVIEGEREELMNLSQESKDAIYEAFMDRDDITGLMELSTIESLLEDAGLIKEVEKIVEDARSHIIPILPEDGKEKKQTPNLRR